MENKVSCPICKSDQCAPDYVGKAQRAAWQDGRAWAVWRCQSCAHGFMYPQPDAETLTAYYGKDYDPYSATHGVAGDMASIVETARKTGRYRHVAIRPGMRLLDVGCGGGSFLKVARAIGAEAEGVEPSDHGVDTCRTQDIPVFHGTLTEFLQTGAAGFDLITANHVVEHHPDPVAFLDEARQLLAPGGSSPQCGQFPEPATEGCVA